MSSSLTWAWPRSSPGPIRSRSRLDLLETLPDLDDPIFDRAYAQEPVIR
jgi:hypothetical protein